MELQRILFPRDGKCTEKELYFRTEENTEIVEESKRILLKKGEKILFDTYFNSFSVSKWKKYTVIDDVFLKIKLAGNLKVRLLCGEIIDGKTKETVISEKTVVAGSMKNFEFDFENFSNLRESIYIYTFEIEALSDNSRVAGGAYCSRFPYENLHHVKVGINICTYKREEYIEKNIKKLNEEILNNTESPAFGHLEVFIADNGQSLEKDRLQTDKIHIYPNRNLGGAGGFTRNLIEIFSNRNKSDITHVLFMDDDVVIEPEAVIRTYMLLSLIRKEYEDSFIGGAMLRLDKPYIQTESGARWNEGELEALKSNLDMRMRENCLYNEQEEDAEYNAWWFCCLPMSIVRADNLPLPIFIRYDDVEYGLRNMKNLILLNGICVWHEPFENKYSSYLEYYTARNQLIDNAFHCREKRIKDIERGILSRCVQEIMFYRYKNVELYLQGVLDFLKGPAWLMEQNAEELHKKVTAAGYKAQPIEMIREKKGFCFKQNEYETNCRLVDTKYEKIKRYLTFNGLFLPSDGESCVPMPRVRTVQCYRKKRVLHYDEMNHTGFMTEKSAGLSIKYIGKMLLVMLQIAFQYKKIQAEYCTKGMELRTLEVWKCFLEL